MKARNQCRAILAIIAQIAAGIFFMQTAQAQGNYSWLGSTTMQIASKQYPITVASFSPSQFGTNIPTGSKISGVNVYISGTQASQVSLRTYVCYNGTTQCVQASGNPFNTNAFDSLDASKPIYVSHEVIGWRTAFPPIFIPTTVTVSYITQ